MAFAETAPHENQDEVVSFPTWRKVLAEQALPEKVRRDFQRDIVGLLTACKAARRPVSTGFIRWYLGRRGLTEVERQYEREALKWFFQEAKRSGGVAHRTGAFVPPAAYVAALEAPPRRNAGVPPPLAANDLGQTEWERALVAAMRQRCAGRGRQRSSLQSCAIISDVLFSCLIIDSRCAGDRWRRASSTTGPAGFRAGASVHDEAGCL